MRNIATAFFIGGVVAGLSAQVSAAELILKAGGEPGGITSSSMRFSAEAAAPSPLTFNFTKGGGILALESSLDGDDIALAASVVAGFEAAGDLWRGFYEDNVTVNVVIDFQLLDPDVLGQTTNVTIGSRYSDVRSALIADATSSSDAIAAANLQPGPTLDIITNDTENALSPRTRDNDGSGNNGTLEVPRANAKALGTVVDLTGVPLDPHDTGTDGGITFSSDFTWDFDPTDGIASGAFDFIAVAAHEIGHLMGFASGVDVVDGASSDNLDIDSNRVFSVLDLFRYSSDSLSATGQPSNGAVLDLAVGGTPFFSIDAGATGDSVLAAQLFATGESADGDQASHWKDGLGLGLMDPTLANSTVGDISELDLEAFDVIGWDRIVPEPTTGVLLVLAGLSLCQRPRRVIATV